MRAPAVAAAVALLALTTACGGSQAAEPAASSAPEPSESSESSSESPATSAAGGAGDGVLLGAVGTPDDPEAFTITLTDSAGEPVTSVPAGEYEVRVSDPAATHNFHLSGPGVDETTTVPETTEVTWTVTLEPGEYDFVCDPHLQGMSGTLTVT